MPDTDPKPKRRQVTEYIFTTERLRKRISWIFAMGNSRMLVIERRGVTLFRSSFTVAVIFLAVFIFFAWRIAIGLLILAVILRLRLRIMRQL